MTPNASRSSLDVNRDVRRILVAQWIDLGRISVHSVKNSVYLRGSLQKLPGSDSTLTPAAIDSIYKKIRMVGGVKHVYVDFDNWFLNKSTGAWESVDERARIAHRTSQDFGQAPRATDGTAGQ